MTAAPPSLPDGFTAETDEHGGWWVSRDGVQVAHLFPRLASDPGGLWYGRLPGKPAKLCTNYQTAVDHIVRHVLEEKP